MAEKSVLIKNMVGDLGEDAMEDAIPIPNINAAVLKKVIDWCEHHVHDAPTSNEDDSDVSKKTNEIEEWDQQFMQVDQEMLFEIILAANYLEIQALLDVGCRTVANMIKGKSPEEIRKTFNIQNDFTPEEEDQIRRENEWAEEYVSNCCPQDLSLTSSQSMSRSEVQVESRWCGGPGVPGTLGGSIDVGLTWRLISSWTSFLVHDAPNSRPQEVR